MARRAIDEHAFGLLLDGHRAGLELFCRVMLGDPDAASRAVAETVMAAWGERQNVPRQTTARMWLYRIAAHVCIDATEDTTEAE